jgi:electron transport complex protein RnfE
VNCIIIARCEVCAVKSRLIPSLCDAVGQGIGFTIALSILGTIREIIGNGTLLNHPVMWSGFEKWVIMILPPGAFILLGIMISVANYIRARRSTGGAG